MMFNLVLVAAQTDEATEKILQYIQQSGESWMGGTRWQGQLAIRISVCSWRTSAADIEQTIRLFARAQSQISERN